MNKSVNPLLAFAVIAFFVAIFAVNFWLNQQILSMDRFSNAHMSSTDTLAVQYGKQILQVDLRSGKVSRLELGDLGINESIGDFEFFSNGDLLIRIGSLERSSLDATAAVFQIQNHKQGKESAEAGALYRCRLTSRECDLFGDELPVMNRSFRLAIDRNTDTIFLADTSRHQLFKLDSAGRIIASKAGFRFPNQPIFADGKLLLADTNNHRVVELDSSDANFGAVIDEHETRLGGEHKWPFTLARVGSNWWVNIPDNDMKNGRIAIYNAQWHPIGEVELPTGADPIALLAYDDRVLVTGNRQFRIYQFDFAGKLLDDLHITALAGELHTQKEQARKYKQYGYLCWFLGVIAFIIGCYFGIKEQLVANRQLRKQRESGTSAVCTPQALPASGEWIEPGKHIKLFSWLLVLIAIAMAISMATLAISSEKPLPTNLLLLVMGSTFMFMPLSVPFLRLSKFRIGVFDDYLEIIDHHGKNWRNPWVKVLWTEQMVKIENYAIPLGRGAQNGIFPRKQIDALVRPRLSNWNKITALEALRYQWQSPEGILKFSALTMVFMVFLMLMIERESILNALQSTI